MIKAFKKILNFIESYPLNFWLWLSAFSAIIIFRILIENWLATFKNRSGLFLFYEFTHTFLFFLISYILFAILLKKFLKTELKKISNILLWGFLIILAPPIIDYIISNGKGYWSFYEFDGIQGLIKRFFIFYGDTPEIGITYGVRFEVALSLFFIFIYSLAKLSENKNFSNFINWKLIENLKLKIKNYTKNYQLINLIKALIITFVAYIIFFILGTFPSYIAILIRGFSKGFINVSAIDVAQMFLTPAHFFSHQITDIVSSLNIKMSLIYSLLLVLLLLIISWHLNKEKIKIFLVNARYPQLIYHGGLLVLGIGLACIFNQTTIEINFFNILSFLALLLAVFFTWLASLVPNDIYDLESDRLTPNKNRPLVQKVFTLEEYKILGWALFIFSLLLSAIVNFKIAALLFVYQAIAWLYSCPPFRLKRIAFISTFISALASLLILFSGYILVSPNQDLAKLPFSLILLLIFGYTFSLPIKDFKDIQGDKKNGIFTVPVLFGEYWGKIIVSTGLFISFMFSVVILNEFRLFFCAFFCGGISYWIVLFSSENGKITYKRLPWWILGLVFIYGLILVGIIFFNLL